MPAKLNFDEDLFEGFEVDRYLIVHSPHREFFPSRREQTLPESVAYNGQRFTGLFIRGDRGLSGERFYPHHLKEVF